MDNLNDPQGGNIIPGRQGDGGDSSKWNCVPFVSVVGIAALRTYYTTLLPLRFQNKIKETKVEIYPQALDSQNQKLEEERPHMRLEIKNEISREFQKALEIEKKQEQSALEVLDQVEYRLMERQWDYCSNLSSMRPVKKEDLEKNLLVYSAKQPLLAHLKMEDGLSDIFKNDRTCAEYLNTDKRKNGSLMWLYLKYWKLQLTLQSHKNAEAVLNTQTKE
uniref:Coiled-coil domain containing 127b n=1 Tax=Sinocyclocheilus grahami TaxID=75366 RepID=A0A672L926_SINGR